MMHDREKVIKGLALVREHLWYQAEQNKQYRHYYVELDSAVKDALDILKEQEAVAPTLIREGRNKNYNDYVCPRCDNEVVYEQNYCSECGAQFLWERAVE